MEHAIIAAHPLAKSFTMEVASAYCEAVRSRGHDASLRDLYRMNFAPTLGADEFPRPGGFTPGEDVVSERRSLAHVGVFVFIYPFWMNAHPAMMKGYIDRVFGLGFAYAANPGGNKPLLTSRKMISYTSSGAPTQWMIDTGAWRAVRKLFDEHFAAVCGLEIVDHVHFGDVVPGMRADVVARHLDCVRTTVARYF